MIEITIPRLGWSMEEGTFSEWLKRDGDWVHKGDMLFVLESDKAAQEIESFEAGVLRIDTSAPKPGDTVKVGQIIGYLLAREEVESFVTPVAETPLAKPSQPDSEAVTTTTRIGSQVERAPVGVIAPQAVASPRARRAADEHGIDWRTLTGTGRDGRVRERDVLAAAYTGEKPVARPISAMRRTIAERMTASARSTAPVTLTTQADASNLVNLRAQFRAASQDESAPTVSDVVVKLTAKALASHHDINARWNDDEIVRLAEINIGVAVDTDAGLLVPVIRDVPGQGLKEIAARSRALIEKARGRRLTADELSGGTFTVTNLGMYGIDAFTPIINLPETAILGIGAIRKMPIVLDDDRIVPGQRMVLSLTFDHRVVDGAAAARFLATLRTLLENPAASLLE